MCVGGEGEGDECVCGGERERVMSLCVGEEGEGEECVWGEGEGDECVWGGGERG